MILKSFKGTLPIGDIFAGLEEISPGRYCWVDDKELIPVAELLVECPGCPEMDGEYVYDFHLSECIVKSVVSSKFHKIVHSAFV